MFLLALHDTGCVQSVVEAIHQSFIAFVSSVGLYFAHPSFLDDTHSFLRSRSTLNSSPSQDLQPQLAKKGLQNHA
jgi:hypothetical protein